MPAAGLMTNYVYELRDFQRNHELYIHRGEICSSARMERLARQAPAARNTNWLTRHFA